MDVLADKTNELSLDPPTPQARAIDTLNMEVYLDKLNNLLAIMTTFEDNSVEYLVAKQSVEELIEDFDRACEFGRTQLQQRDQQ